MTDAPPTDAPAPDRARRFNPHVPGFYAAGGGLGLGTRVAESGRQTWRLRYVSPTTGKRRELLLGVRRDTPTGPVVMTTEKARALAHEKRQLIRDGVDPLEQRDADRAAKREQTRRAEITFGELAEAYLAKGLTTKSEVKRERQRREDRRRFETYLAVWRNRPAVEITRDDAEDLHSQLPGRCSKGSRGGAIEANRCIKLGALIFDASRRRLPPNHPNPFRGFKRHPEYKRERRADDVELRALLAGIGAEPAPDARVYLTLLLLTLCRKRELLQSRWRDVVRTLNGDVLLSLPKEHTKTGKLRNVALSARAVELLAWWRVNCHIPNPGGWLFPSPVVRPQREGRRVEYGPRSSTWANLAWDRVRERAGVTGVTLHDLRRTGASWSVETAGFTSETVAAALGQHGLRTVEVYARFSPAKARPLLDTFGQHIAAQASAAGVPALFGDAVTVDAEEVGRLALDVERDEDPEDDAAPARRA